MINDMFDDPEFMDDSEVDMYAEVEEDAELDEDGFCCNKCKVPFKSEGDIFPYDDLELCQPCYDKQMRQDEMEVQEWECDNTRDY